jgi:hypothetical protein
MPHRVARRTIAIVGLPVALWWLQPWKLLIRTTADERLPSGAQTTSCENLPVTSTEPAELRAA